MGRRTSLSLHVERSRIRIRQLKIIEIAKSSNRLLKGTEKCIDRVFPEYALTNLSKRLNIYQSVPRKPSMQVFVALINQEVVSFAQILYRDFDGCFVGDIDLLGTLPKYRRNGLASALFQHVINESKRIANNHNSNIIGLLTLIEASDKAIDAFHTKHGGQIRTDECHQSGNSVVWYPFAENFSDIKTTELLKYANGFGKMIKSFL